MNLHHALAAAALFAFASPSDARAWSTVFHGQDAAHECSVLALLGDASDGALDICTEALYSQLYTPKIQAKTYTNRAVIYLTRRELEKCRADLATAQTLDPDLGELYVNRGALYIFDRRFKDAVDEITRGLALNSSEPAKAYYNRAMAREGVDDVQGAYQDYRKAAELNPGWKLPELALARFKVEPR